MSTHKETADLILEILGDPKVFSVRSMFGEYALYANKKVVGLICDDLLYVKILAASNELEDVCEKDTPYPGAKLWYVLEEEQFSRMDNLSELLVEMARSLPAPKPKKKKPTKK